MNTPLPSSKTSATSTTSVPSGLHASPALNASPDTPQNASHQNSHEQHHVEPHSLKRVALVGNPNSGKTTAFNSYTGTHQHVGNYPGVTVDKKEGLTRLSGEDILLVDLPGTYSLTAYSQEELVTRAVLTDERPLAVIDVVDASALERNLYLTVQLMEMGLPVVLACNMMDEARRAGMSIDTALLSQRMGIPVVETVARTGEGLPQALKAALDFGQAQAAGTNATSSDVISGSTSSGSTSSGSTSSGSTSSGSTSSGAPLYQALTYGPDLDPVLQSMQAIVQESGLLANSYSSRWVALKLLEGDTCIWREAKAFSAESESFPALDERLRALCDTVTEHIRSTLGVSPEAVIADYRYGYIRGMLRNGVITKHGTRDRLELSDKLDKVLTNALLGPLIMLGILFLVFQLTFVFGAYPQGWIESGFAMLSEILNALLPDGLLKSLLVSGIIAGVGGVIGFVPLIMIMFLLISFLEDSGYMARIAYMLDRVFRAFGLHGCSVMPYIVSGGIAGGCAIPGAMATRTLRSPKEKLATLLTLPYMACGAKLPVFMLLTGVFFPSNQATVMFTLTLAGWAVALLVARVLRSTIIRGEATPFVMELPPYRLPTLQSLGIHCWERTWMYLKKAGTVLVAMSVLIWASMTFPDLDSHKAAPLLANISTLEQTLERESANTPGSSEVLETTRENLETARENLASEKLRHSFAGRLGTALEPFTLVAGFDWRTDIALLGGIAAKEAIVSTLGTAYALGEQDPEDAAPLAQRITQDPNWSKGTALALMLFVLLYSPCFVALVVIRQEAGSWGWVVFSILFNTGLAFGVAVSAFQIGKIIWG